MLIDLSDAVARYDTSQTTIARRIRHGELTKHPARAGSSSFRLDTKQLDRHFALRNPQSAAVQAEVPDDAASSQPVIQSVEPTSVSGTVLLPRGMAGRLVPSPAQLQAAMQRALDDAPTLPRLVTRRR